MWFEYSKNAQKEEIRLDRFRYGIEFVRALAANNVLSSTAGAHGRGFGACGRFYGRLPLETTRVSPSGGRISACYGLLMKNSHVSRLNDAELLARIAELVREANRNLAVLLQHLAELDSRRLYLEQACSSLFRYCVQRLGFSESATYNRMTAARLGRRFPVVFQQIEAGRLYLTAVRLLAPHLTDENHAELLEAAVGKSKRGLEVVLAERSRSPRCPRCFESFR